MGDKKLSLKWWVHNTTWEGDGKGRWQSKGWIRRAGDRL